MRSAPFLKLATTILAASAVLATACSEQNPTAPGRMATKNLRPSSTVITTTTVWDFVQLAGGEGAQGNSKTFTIAGAGSVVASASATNPVSEVYSKGFALPPGDEERGLGLCQDLGLNSLCVGVDDEIGDDFGTGTVLTPLYLDFTGLTTGSVVTSVTLSSVQLGEGYSVSFSTDGSSYTLLQNGVGTGAAVFSIDVPAATKFLRFDVGPGGAGNNYLVQSATVVTTTTTGKTFTIGPSSMEGAILISNGDWVNGGYSFKFVNGTHLATNFSVHAFVSLTGPCIGGGPATDTFTFPLNDATYAVPANNTNWLPTGDANSVLSWQGSVIASGVCGGIGKLDARHGAVFTATVSQDPPSGSLVDFRFKYRDPKAKGKPNTNCLDTSDPNRAKADVCGASWSQTVRDP